MKYLIIRTLGVLGASYVTGVGVQVVLALSTGITALVTASVLAIINHTIKPMFTLISIPINLLTLGLFSFVINGLMILLASRLVDGFAIPSLLYAIYFSIVLSVINWLLHVFE